MITTVLNSIALIITGFALMGVHERFKSLEKDVLHWKKAHIQLQEVIIKMKKERYKQ